MRNSTYLIVVIAIIVTMLIPTVSASGYSTNSHSTTPEASDSKVTSVKLDARELLFGKRGDSLTLEVTIEPKDASASGSAFTSSDISVATVNKNGKVRAKGWGSCTITVKVGGKKAKCKVTVAKKWIALTFDDGPGAYTNKLLKAMKKKGVHATFFVVGSMASSQERRDTLKKAFDQGNEIGNHTWRHDGSANSLTNALKKTDKVVKAATGKKTKLMRPPGGAINSAMYKCGKPIILWSVDPKDWRDRNAQTVYDRVMNSIGSGSIVLLHDIHPTSVTAAIRIMDTLKEKGYAFVTVSQLLDDPQNGKVYYKGSSKVRTMKIE